MQVQDLLLADRGLREQLGAPDMNPLLEEGALQEAQLLEVRFDALTQTVGLLFELRVALQLRATDTGVLVARGVREFSWTGPGRETALTGWTIGGSVPRLRNGLFGIRLDLWPAPGARLDLVSESATFVTGHVPGLADTPPDYTDVGRPEVNEELAGWASPFEPVSVAFIDATAG